MIIENAYAKSSDFEILGQFSMFIPLILIFFVMYFLVIRPQRMQIKKHQEMINSIRRGDIVVTAGGILGKVIKVHDNVGEIDIEISDGTRVRVIRNTLSGIRNKDDFHIKSIENSK